MEKVYAKGAALSDALLLESTTRADSELSLLPGKFFFHPFGNKQQGGALQPGQQQVCTAGRLNFERNEFEEESRMQADLASVMRKIEKRANQL